MTREQFLLLKLTEECAEVSQRASKQIQFGKDEIQKDQTLTNGERLKNELIDLIAITHFLIKSSEVPGWGMKELKAATTAKKQKLQKYLDLSNSLGQLPKITL